MHLRGYNSGMNEYYQLFLFDFDGILVDTEELHYKAYLKMCVDRGFILNWDRPTYMSYALFTATGVKEAIYKALPQLHETEPNWNVLYQEKKAAYCTLLREEGTKLMPGVEALLQKLESTNTKRCVVTHSPADQIAMIRGQHPILNTIPHWITREHYSQPKPASECYAKALTMLKAPGERAIGFEDSPRGLKALLGTEADGVFVTEYFEPPAVRALTVEIGRPFSHLRSFTDLDI